MNANLIVNCQLLFSSQSSAFRYHKLHKFMTSCTNLIVSCQWLFFTTLTTFDYFALLFTFHFSLFTFHFSLFTIHYSLFTIRSFAPFAFICVRNIVIPPFEGMTSPFASLFPPSKGGRGDVHIHAIEGRTHRFAPTLTTLTTPDYP